MNGKPADGQAGFTYLAVLIMVVVFGIALSGTSRYWQTVMKREREAALLFRGGRIRRAVESFVLNGPKGRPERYPKQLEDLVKDPRFPVIRRHIRKIYPDPMMPDGQWGIIRGKSGEIRGVFSRSEEAPLKTGNFPEEYNMFEGAENYSKWRFVYLKNSSQASSPVQKKKTQETEEEKNDE